MHAGCQVNNIDIDLIYSDTIEENIISINTKKELFFDVYECTVNDEKLVLEKVGDSELGPKVLLEINIEGKKYSAEAILVDNGTTYIELNKENIYFIRTIPEENVTVENNEIEEVNTEEETSDNLEVNYENIIEHHVNNKLVFLHELEEQFEEKIVSLKDDISNKLDLFFEKLEDKKKVIVEKKLEKITANLDEKFTTLRSELQGVEDFSKENIDKILENKIIEIDNSVSLFLEGITKEYKNKIISSDKKITHNFLELNSIKDKLKESNSVTNKKFEDLNLLKEKLLQQDELVLKNQELKKFITEEFENIDSKFKNLSEEESKKYDELLAAVNNKDVVEYKTILKEKIQDVELTQIKESLQEEISSALKGDIVSLKRYVEMSSGGGSTAKQFAAGGTMDGTLNVNGDILSGGTNLIDVFNTDTSINLQDVTNNGNTTTNLISSNNTIVADTILATNILSSTNLDIGFELSGFNVTGDLSASGNISSSSLITSALSTDGIDAKFTDNVIIAGDLDIGFPNENENQCIVIHGSTSSGKRTMLKQDGDKFCLSPQVGNQTLILGSGSNNVTCMCGNASHEVRMPTKVSIGITGGTEKLTVAGNISASGNLSAAEIKGTKLISTGNVELGGNILDTDANELINIASNDITFVGKHIKSGFGLGVRNQRGNAKGMDCSTGSNTYNLGIFNCSVEAITIDNTGNVGIGTTAPNNQLTVSGSISSTSLASVSALNVAGGQINFGDRTSNDILIKAESDSNDLTLFRAASFADSVGVSLKYLGSGSDDENIFEIKTDAGGSLKIDNSGDVGINTAPIDGKDLTADEVVVNTNLGIGTTAPSQLLHVSGGKALVEQTSSAGSVIVNRTDGRSTALVAAGLESALLYDSGGFFSIQARSGSDVLVGNGDTNDEVIRIDSSGNVGIGRTDPSKLLDIKDGDFRISSTEPKIFLNDTNNNSDFSIKNNNGSFQISDTTNGPTRLAIDSSGNVGIGTNSPNEALTVVGSISATGLASVSSLEIISDGSSSSDNSPFKFEVAADRKNTATTALYIYPKDTTNHRVYFQNPAQDRNSYAVNFSGLTQIEDTPAFNNLTAKSTTTNGDNFGLGTVTAGTGVRRSGTTDNFDLFVSHSSNTPDFVFHTKTGGFFSSDSQLDGTNEVMRLTNDGKVGIGTATPNVALTVAGNISATNTIASSAGHFADAVGDGKVLIGHTTSLHNTADLEISSAGTARIMLKDSDDSDLHAFIDKNHAQLSLISQYNTSHGTIALRSFNGTTTRTNLFIAVDGDVGIGTTAPGAKLTVAGNISASGGLSATKIIGGINNNNSGPDSFIGGGASLSALGNCSVVTGGKQNIATVAYATVGGGIGNRSTGIYGSTVGGGYFNFATGYSSTVAGGQNNRAQCTGSFIGGGSSNYATGFRSSAVGGTYNRAIGQNSIVGGGYTNRACANNSSVLGGHSNLNSGLCSSILGGANNCINTGHNCSFIIGTGITSSAACTTFVNNLTSLGTLDGCSIESKNGFKIGEDAIVTYNTSFTLPLSDNGRTTLLDTTSGSIVVTVPNLETGFSNRFIKEAGAAPVVFSVGNGLSALGSYQDRNQLNIIYAQADIFYKNENYAFIGGNLE
tara:strand:+ start:12455 stop:17284 length:4830 start_codon:yes stop_codon:yes gene_type:complete